MFSLLWASDLEKAEGFPDSLLSLQKDNNEDMKAYTTRIGQGVIIIGIGCGFTGAFNYLTKSAGGWVCFGLTFLYGLSIVFRAQKKYNGGLF